MKKILLSLIIILGFASNAYSNQVSLLTYDVAINDDGSANITQIWNGNFTEGSENYIGLNCNDFTVSDVKVSSDDNSEWEDKGTNWDINASRQEKVNKYGIHRVDNEYIEICWGIGEYGNRTYKVEYKISSLVKRCSDGVDGFNFKFLDTKFLTPTKLDMTIRLANGKEINADNARIWGFGYKGQIIFDGGVIKAYTESDLGKSNYVTVCCSLDGLVEPAEKNSRSFEEIYYINK